MTEQLKETTIKYLREMYGDKKVLLEKSLKPRSWTGNEMADEIENETEKGLSWMQMLINLTIDLLSRNKINNE